MEATATSTKKELKGPLTLNLPKDEIICMEGDQESDLFIVHKGKLLVFIIKGTTVTPVAYINSGEYLGELSFFDGEPRSACVATLEDTTLIQIPVVEKKKQFPNWLTTLAKSMTKRTRYSNELLKQKGIRKKNVESIAPLSIDEQRHYFKLIEQYKSVNIG